MVVDCPVSGCSRDLQAWEQAWRRGGLSSSMMHDDDVDDDVFNKP